MLCVTRIAAFSCAAPLFELPLVLVKHQSLFLYRIPAKVQKQWRSFFQKGKLRENHLMKSLLFGKVGVVFFSSFWGFLCTARSPRDFENSLSYGAGCDRMLMLWASLRAAEHRRLLEAHRSSASGRSPPTYNYQACYCPLRDRVVLFWLWSQGANSK